MTIKKDINQTLSIEAFCAVLVDQLCEKDAENMQLQQSCWLNVDTKTKEKKINQAIKAYNSWYFKELNSAERDDSN